MKAFTEIALVRYLCRNFLTVPIWNNRSASVISVFSVAKNRLFGTHMREQQYVANRRAVREQHDQAINADALTRSGR